MSIAFIAIGDEVLRGETRESNAQLLAERLRRLGAALDEIRVVSDAPRAIVSAIRDLAGPGRLVLTSGGLGPTGDDGSRAAVADAAGVPLVDHPELADGLRARYRRLGGRWISANLVQARLPASASPLANRHGTAPGFVVPVAGGTIACLPGPPREFGAMLDDHLHALLHAAGVRPQPVSEHCLRVIGISESALQERLEALDGHARVRVRSLPSFPEIRLEIRAGVGANPNDAADFAERAARDLSWRVFGRDRDCTFAGAVAAELIDRGLRVAVAESCTGGLIGHLLTDVPGVSATLQADLVTYANAAKTALLGVPESVLEEHGAVSEATARAMAEGARTRTGADYAVATTGIAGPTGGSARKPVGTVCFAVAGPKHTVAKTRLFSGLERARFKRLAAYSALALLRRALISSGPTAASSSSR